MAVQEAVQKAARLECIVKSQSMDGTGVALGIQDLAVCCGECLQQTF